MFIKRNLFLILLISFLLAACDSGGNNNDEEPNPEDDTTQKDDPIVDGVPPATPQNIQITALAEDIEVSWTNGDESTDGVTYNVYMAEEAGITADNIDTLTGGMRHEAVSSPFTHGSGTLDPNKAYYIVVTAVNQFGESALSEEKSATPLQSTGTAPATPANVQATPVEKNIQLSWDSVDGATSYNLYMAEEAGITPENFVSKIGGMEHLNVASPYSHEVALDSDKTYHFVIVAVNAAGASPASTEVSAKPKPASGGNIPASSGPFGLYFGSLVAVDMSDPTKTYNIMDKAPFAYGTLTTGTLDMAETTLSDIHNTAYIYLKDQKVWYLDLEQDSQLTPRQISSLEYRGNCNETPDSIHLMENVLAPDNSYLIVTDAGLDGNCANTDDNLHYLVRVGADSSEAPMDITGKKDHTGDIRMINGTAGDIKALAGFLVTKVTGASASLRRYDANFENPVDITLPAATSIKFENASGAIVDGHYLVLDNNELYFYGDDGLSAPVLIHTTALNTSTINEIECNASTCVLRETEFDSNQNDFFTFTAGGSSTSTAFYDDNNYVLMGFNLTDSKAYIWGKDSFFNDRYELFTVNLADSKKNDLAQSITEFSLITTGDSAYYTVWDDETTVTTHYRSGPADNSIANFGGRIIVGALLSKISRTQRYGPNHIIMATNVSDITTRFGSKPLRALDTGTNQETAKLGSTDTTVDALHIFGMGTKLLGVASYDKLSGPDKQTEVIYIDALSANSLTRMTNTDGVNERPQ